MQDGAVAVEPQTKFPNLNKAMGNEVKAAPAEPAAAPAAEEPAPDPAPAVDPAPAAEEPQAAAPKSFSIDDVDGMDEEAKEALIQKLTGKSSDEIKGPKKKSKEEEESEAEQFKNDALAWSIESGRVSRKEYEAIVADKTKTNRELALKVFTASIMAEDKDATPEECEELFRDTYHEDKADDNPKLFAVGQKEIETLANNYRKQHFSAVDGMEDTYREHLSIQGNYKAYKSQVKKVAEALPKEFSVSVPYTTATGEETSLEYKFPVEQSVVDKIVANASGEKSFSLRDLVNDGKIDYKAVQYDMENSIKAAIFDKMMPEILRQHGEEVEKRLMVVLGNKKSTEAVVNTGIQPLADPAPKINSYPNLHATRNKKNN